MHPLDLTPLIVNRFAGNEDLEKAVRLFEGELMGPEGFAVDGDGT